MKKTITVELTIDGNLDVDLKATVEAALEETELIITATVTSIV